MKHTGKRLLRLLLVLSMVVGLFSTTASAVSMDSITDLKVNNLVSPMGLDQMPHFRWVNHLTGYSKSQSAYQIIVSSSAALAAERAGDLWNSEKVAGTANFDIAYAGANLTSRTACYWRVRIWDEQDNASEWSEVATFETGVLDASQWTAKWITSRQQALTAAKVNLSGANWIWSRYGAAQDGVPAETMYFRSTFEVDANKTVDKAYIGFTTDDYGTVYVNYAAAGALENKSNSWQGGCVADITAMLHPGTNSIAAEVTNGAVGYAGFVGKIVIAYTDGTTDEKVTDGSWKLSKTIGAGWNRPNYNDTAWETPDQVLPYGSSPWGTQVSLQRKVDSAEILSAPMLRRSFQVGKKVAKARAYVSGMGLFEMKINGQLPDDTVLNPAHTQYEDTVNYRVFDVTGLLQQGQNAITAEVGNSFYNCIINTWSWPDAVWRDHAKFMMELVVEYTDGTSESIITDEKWKSYAKGPVVENDMYTGETYDARKEVAGWEDASFDDSAWEAAILEDAPAGKLTFEEMEPVRRLETFKPEVVRLDQDSFVIKNPVMATGWAKITFDARAGTEINIIYGEQLGGNGALAKIGLEGHILQSDVYICKGGGPETYEPRFSYKGYHYIQVDGYPGELTADDVECYLIATDVDVVSDFETSRELINTMHTNMRRTMRNNMQGKPTDTPVWEKNGWTGDFNVSLRSFNYNFDTTAFFKKFQGDLRDSARSDGAIPNISPTANWGMGNSPVWNTAYINSLYEEWKSYGQLSTIQEHYDAMRKQTLLYISKLSGRGWVWGDGELADWVAPDGDAGASEGSGICATAYVYFVLGRMAEIADAMGKRKDAAEYRAARPNIYDAFNAKFYNAEKGYYETTTWSDPGGNRTRYRQTSNLVPLAFGLCPEEFRKSVLKSLVDHIVNVKNVHLDTGVVGTQLLLTVLSDQGYDELAFALLTQTTYPSWGYWVDKGTSIWEGYSMRARSRNHYFLGTYEEWLYSHLAGIRNYDAGYKTVTIDPYITGQLSHVNCSLDTVRGKLRSNWRLDGKALTMNVEIPVGTTATIYLPVATAAEAQVNGVALASQPGISAVAKEKGQVKVTAGSGAYAFTMDVELEGSTLSLIQALGTANERVPGGTRVAVRLCTKACAVSIRLGTGL